MRARPPAGLSRHCELTPHSGIHFAEAALDLPKAGTFAESSSIVVTPALLSAAWVSSVGSTIICLPGSSPATAIAAGTFITVFWDTAFVRTHLPAYASDSDFAIFPALALSVLGLVLVSALTRPPSAEQVALFHSSRAEPAESTE